MIKRDNPDVELDAPIPGQSLTAPLGDRPWQKPARFPTPDEALAFYIDRITRPKQATRMFSVLENGVPVETLVDIMQTGGVMEGLHSLDVGIVITPALVEVISQMATKAEVDFKQQTEVERDTMNDSEIKSILKEIEDVPYPTPEPVAEEPVVEEEPKGLMARRAM